MAKCLQCGAPAIAIFRMSRGCWVYPNEIVQPLCPQHIVKATPIENMELIEDLRIDKSQPVQELGLPMRDLLFKNPVFRPGMNVTVRNGLKWDSIIYSLPWTVNIKQSSQEDKVITTGVVVGKMVLPAYRIPEEILLMEHDPKCRSLDGLTKTMKSIYGDNWTNDNIVTVIFFRVDHV